MTLRVIQPVYTPSHAWTARESAGRRVSTARRVGRPILLAQAISLGGIASVAGLVVARVAALACDHLARTRLPPFPFKPDVWFVFSPGLVLGVFAFGVGACVLSALVPVARAARVEPPHGVGSTTRRVGRDRNGRWRDAGGDGVASVSASRRRARPRRATA